MSCNMWFFLLLVSSLAASAWAHGRVLEPPSRASAWRFGYAVEPNYDDDGLNCGGFSAQHTSNGGKCGICGDPYNLTPPRPHELGGTYGVGVITGRYQPGGLVTTTVDLTTSHKGFWEFKLCPDPESTDQACFDRYVLEHEEGDTKYYPNRGSTKYNVTYKLPDKLVCEHCVLQWRYTAGNNWGSCGNGTSGLGCGPQEQFGACSDISIGNSKRLLRGGENDIAPLVYYLKNGYFDAQQGVLHLLRGKVRQDPPGSRPPQHQPTVNQIQSNQKPAHQPTGLSNQHLVLYNQPSGHAKPLLVHNNYPIYQRLLQNNQPTLQSNPPEVQNTYPSAPNQHPVQINGLSNLHLVAHSYPTGPSNLRPFQNNQSTSPSTKQRPKQNVPNAAHPNSIQMHQKNQKDNQPNTQSIKKPVNTIQKPYRTFQQTVIQTNIKGNPLTIEQLQQLQQLQHIQQLINPNQQNIKPNQPNIQLNQQNIKPNQQNIQLNQQNINPNQKPIPPNLQNEKLIQQAEIQHYYNKKHQNQYFQNTVKHRKRQPRGRNKQWKRVKYGIPHKKRKRKKGKHRKKKKKVAYYEYY